MKKHKGFTLIEVVLVLAIAGLILVMVFIALPALQRSQRDAQRRDDMLVFVQRLKNFQTNNNRGALPSGTYSEPIRRGNADAKDKTSWAAFYRDFFDDNYVDPSGEPYKLVITDCTSDPAHYDQSCDKNKEVLGMGNGQYPDFPNDYKIYVVIGAKCNGEKALGAANTRKVAVLYKLEGGGVYCGES